MSKNSFRPVKKKKKNRGVYFTQVQNKLGVISGKISFHFLPSRKVSSDFKNEKDDGREFLKIRGVNENRFRRRSEMEYWYQ